MKMGFVIENTHCTAEVSKISWWITLTSMITHPTNPDKWRYLALKKNNHIKYKNRDVLYVKLKDLDWNWCDEIGFYRWCDKAGFGCLLKTMEGENANEPRRTN